jgi:hypothetical protein
MRDSAKSETVLVVSDQRDNRLVFAASNDRPVMGAFLDGGIEFATEFCSVGFVTTDRR